MNRTSEHPGAFGAFTARGSQHLQLKHFRHPPLLPSSPVLSLHTHPSALVDGVWGTGAKTIQWGVGLVFSTNDGERERETEELLSQSRLLGTELGHPTTQPEPAPVGTGAPSSAHGARPGALWAPSHPHPHGSPSALLSPSPLLCLSHMPHHCPLPRWAQPVYDKPFNRLRSLPKSPSNPGSGIKLSRPLHGPSRPRRPAALTRSHSSLKTRSGSCRHQQAPQGCRPPSPQPPLSWWGMAGGRRASENATLLSHNRESALSLGAPGAGNFGLEFRVPERWALFL